jgi:hypothetical protein
LCACQPAGRLAFVAAATALSRAQPARRGEARRGAASAARRGAARRGAARRGRLAAAAAAAAAEPGSRAQLAAAHSCHRRDAGCEKRAREPVESSQQPTSRSQSQQQPQQLLQVCSSSKPQP